MIRFYFLTEFFKFRNVNCMWVLWVSSVNICIPLIVNMWMYQNHYYKHPEEYQSIFAKTIGPYASIIGKIIMHPTFQSYSAQLTTFEAWEIGAKFEFFILGFPSCIQDGSTKSSENAPRKLTEICIWIDAVNCMYWEQRYPRLLTNKELLYLRNKGQSRLLLVADITCDKGGSIEFVKRVTSIHNPYYRFENFYLINHWKPKSSSSSLTQFGVRWGPQWEIRWKSSFCSMSVTKYVPVLDLGTAMN